MEFILIFGLCVLIYMLDGRCDYLQEQINELKLNKK